MRTNCKHEYIYIERTLDRNIVMNHPNENIDHDNRFIDMNTTLVTFSFW